MLLWKSAEVLPDACARRILNSCWPIDLSQIHYIVINQQRNPILATSPMHPKVIGKSIIYTEVSMPE